MRPRYKDKEKDGEMQKKCFHKKTDITKFYRKNFPFGKKSKPQFYSPPKKCIESCTKCGKITGKWKPAFVIGGVK